MLEISIFFAIFFTSILLVCTVLRFYMVGPDMALQDQGTSQRIDIEPILGAAPFLAWAEHKREITWSNHALKKIGGPIAKLGGAAFTFPDLIQSKPQPRLGVLSGDDTSSKEFNIFNYKVDDLEYYFAFAKDNELKLKTDHNRFIQTLGATFADLQIGIAVFGHDNKLSLFNPALSQHLGLRPEWLLKNPKLSRFLDRLRETHILPEPKNYTSWRKVFSCIERSAMKNDYRESWDLPDGRALRVIGRPHPSGTVVFLFEDITTTLAMERQFRSTLSCFEHTANAATIGFAVFDRHGKAQFLNQTLLHVLGNSNIIKTTQDFSKALQDLFHPTPVWGDFRQFAEEVAERHSWQAEVQTLTGEWVWVNFVPIPNGNTLCEFHFSQKFNPGINVGLACTTP